MSRVFQMNSVLEYQRAAVLHGALCRLLTCHWVHWSPEHLRWDLVALVALVLACRLHWRQAVAALAASSLLIPVALLLLQPGLATYRGLSGLDSALFVLVAAALLAAPRAPRPPRTDDVPPALAARLHALLPRLAAGAALVGFAAKLAWEATTGAAVFVDSQAAAFVPVPLAHLVGGLCGVAALRFLP